MVTNASGSLKWSAYGATEFMGIPGGTSTGLMTELYTQGFFNSSELPAYYSSNETISNAVFWLDEIDTATHRVVYSNFSQTLSFGDGQAHSLNQSGIRASFDGSTFITGTDPKSVVLDIRYASTRLSAHRALAFIFRKR